MNRERARELLPIIQAFAEGKDVQYKANNGRWVCSTLPTFIDNYEWRVKPEPLECWVAFNAETNNPVITGISKEYLENIIGTMDGYRVERMVEADED
jgi:hypothetical protein